MCEELQREKARVLDMSKASTWVQEQSKTHGEGDVYQFEDTTTLEITTPRGEMGHDVGALEVRNQPKG